jgi:hypothetical protein
LEEAQVKDPTRVAAGKKSKRKGNSNENALAKQFKEWWGHGEWARTPSSGGWATAAHREAFRTCGDIITTAVDFPFCVEAKKQEAWDLDALLHNDGCIVKKWWAQAVTESPAALTPLLVMARNRVPQAVMFSARTLSHLPQSPWHFMQHFIARLVLKTPNNNIMIESLVLLPLDAFFTISPDVFGRSLPVSEQGRPKPEDRPSVPEPVIPTCGTCHKPLTQCACTDNDLKK